MNSTVDSASVRPPKARFLNAKALLWIGLLGAALWVFFSNEVALLFDYPLYHSYRLTMIQDRWLLIPHALLGTVAFILGPIQFSSRLRQRNLGLHRILGRLYVVAVYLAAMMAMAISWHREIFPGTCVQACTWILTTTSAWITAKNGHVAVHRQWVARSYAVTFTFVSLRLLSIWPRYWNLSDAANVEVIIATTLGSVLTADIIFNWREFTTRRNRS